MGAPMNALRLRVLYSSFLLLVAILTIQSFANAQVSHMSSGDARITGHVRDAASGEPLTSVRVEVSPLGGVSSVYVQTGTDGEFRIAGVNDGYYDLVINQKGYKPYREPVTLANGNMLVLMITLEKAPADAEAPAAALSAHELTVPQKARDAYLKGIALKAKPDYAGALEQFQKAIKQFPTYYEAYAEAGVAQVNLNKPDDAEKDLQKSIDLSEGKYAPALIYFAGLMNNKRDYADALSMARKGLALDDNAWRGNFEMARALNGLKRNDEAVPYAKKAAQLAPENAQMYVVLMNADLGAHDYPGAMAAIDSFLKLSGTGPQADQVRRLREQVEAAIQKEQAKAAATSAAPAPSNPATAAPAPH
jgi:tetratricopeptide (TPR) repeat protein